MHPTCRSGIWPSGPGHEQATTCTARSLWLQFLLFATTIHDNERTCEAVSSAAAERVQRSVRNGAKAKCGAMSTASSTFASSAMMVCPAGCFARSVLSTARISFAAKPPVRLAPKHVKPHSDIFQRRVSSAASMVELDVNLAAVLQQIV